MKRSEAKNKLEISRQQVRDLKITLEHDTDPKDTLPYTDDEIQRLLRKLPVVMFHASQSVVLKLIDFKEAKRKLKKEQAIAMMQANHKKELTAAEDRKAWAYNQKNVEDAEIDLINAEAESKMAEYHFDSYDNLYMAIKKLVEMRIAQNAAQSNADRSYRQQTPRDQR